jgi:trypsin-like peptidase
MTDETTGFVGLVCEPIDAERSAVIGGCFALYDPCTFVTGDHVTLAAIERGVERLHVIGPGLEPTPVTSVHRHPTADMVVLRAPHTRDVEPFATIATAVVGEPVSVRAYRASAWETLTTPVCGLADLRFTSTAASRATKPEHLVRELAPREYRQAAVMLADAGGHGFSGCPVLAAHGGVVGVVVHSRSFGADDGRGVRRGGAVRLDALAGWLDHIIRQQGKEAA